jgi:hypothetical protein
MDERYDEALKTVDLLMLLQQKEPKAHTHQGSSEEEEEPWPTARKLFSRHPRGFVIPSLQGTYTSLSFGLGSYSSLLERMQRDDFKNSPARTTTEGPVKLFTAELQKPTEKALEFLVDACDKIGKCEGAPMQAEFYLELLKACILEGQPSLAKRILGLREGGQIRLKDSSAANVKAIEDLARRALSSGSATSSVGSPKLSASAISPKRAVAAATTASVTIAEDKEGVRPSVTPKVTPGEKVKKDV